MSINEIDKYLYEINLNDCVNNDIGFFEVIEKISKMDTNNQNIYVSKLNEEFKMKIKILKEGGILNE